MAKPSITLSGPDEHTHIESLADLSAQGAEIAFLYSATPEGRHRYPSLLWITRAVTAVSRAAVHVCGKVARHQLLCEKLDGIIINVNRVQVNGTVSCSELDYLRACYPTKMLIIQDLASNAETVQYAATLRNVTVLVDRSGGRGITPGEWAYPFAPKDGKEYRKAVGFAGGLGIDNMPVELPRIQQVARGAWWVDMETKLRNADDRFDIGKARVCLELFKSST